MINPGLAPGDPKTRPSGSDSWDRFSSASPGFIRKNHLNDRSKVFMLEQLYYERTEFNLYEFAVQLNDFHPVGQEIVRGKS